jgi:prevent-host-death family protein
MYVQHFNNVRSYVFHKEKNMKTVSATELRTNIYQLLDEVLRSGLPIEVKRGERKLRIVPIEKADKFQSLAYRRDVIRGDPEELVTLNWEGEVSVDLP